MELMSKLRVNAPKVTHETIDGESVIINLETGNYYSLQGCGCEIWTLLVAGVPIGKIVDDLCTRYEGARTEIEIGALNLIEQLRTEHLVVADETALSAANGFALPQPSGRKAAFAAPLLQKFTDMQELLLLDPIHEVDEAGWPREKQDN